MNKIIVGKIVKPQGIKGELKVLPLADSPNIFNELNNVYVDGVEYKILSARISDSVYLVLKGIADRNQAELFRNKMIEANKSDIPLPKDRFFVEDILGCEVSLNNGALLGSVQDITTRGSTDVYTVLCSNGKNVMFPSVKNLIETVDIANKKIILFTERFKEVALYED